MALSYRNIKNSASKNYTTYDFPNDLPLQDVVEGTLSFVKSVTSLYIYNNGWQPIAIENEVPTFDSVPPPTVFIPIGGTYSFDLAATDPDGIPITWSYEIVSGSTSVNTLNLSQNTFSFDALDDTLFTVRFKASDTVNEITSDTVFTITNDPPSAPTLLSNGLLSASYSVPTTVNNYQFISVDPEGGNVSYTATEIENKDNLLNYLFTGDTLSAIIDYDVTPVVLNINASDGKYSSDSTFTINPLVPFFNMNASPSYADFANKEPTTDQDVFQRFGMGTNIYKDRMIVAAPYSDDNPAAQFSPSQVGAAFIYKIDDATDTFTLEQQLSSPNATTNSNFGIDCVINDDVAFVGIDGDGTNSLSAAAAGAFEIYTRSGTTWTYSSIVYSPSPTTFGYFGEVMSFDRKNNKLAVGAPGENRVYVYDVSGSTVTLADTITSTGAQYPGTSYNVVSNGFGKSVSIDRGRIAIGVMTRNDEATGTALAASCGAVVIYDYNTNTSAWDFTDVFYENTTQDYYANGDKQSGNAIHLYRNSLIVGARLHQQYQSSGLGKGGVFIYEKVGGTWVKQQEFVGTSIQGTLGRSVQINESRAIFAQDKDQNNNNKITLYKVDKTPGDSWANISTQTDLLNYGADTDTGNQILGLSLWYDRFVLCYDYNNVGTIRYFKATNT